MDRHDVAMACDLRFDKTHLLTRWNIFLSTWNGLIYLKKNTPLRVLKIGLIDIPPTKFGIENRFYENFNPSLRYVVVTRAWFVFRGLNVFFCPTWEHHRDDESRPRYAKRERKTVSDFYWLKTPSAPVIAPGARSTVSRLNGSRGPGRQWVRYRAPPVVLTPA